MAIDYAGEIDALETAIASGATRVSYDGKSVDYDTFTNLLARLSWLKAQQANNAGGRPSAGFASFCRGDER